MMFFLHANRLAACLKTKKNSNMMAMLEPSFLIFCCKDRLLIHTCQAKTDAL